MHFGEQSVIDWTVEADSASIGRMVWPLGVLNTGRRLALNAVKKGSHRWPAVLSHSNPQHCRAVNEYFSYTVQGELQSH